MATIPDQYKHQTQLAAAAAKTDTGRQRRTTQAGWSWQRLLTVGGAGLLWLEPFWVAALVPSLLAREYLWDNWVHPWLVAALFLFWPLRLLATRRLAPPSPLTWPIGLLLGWSWVGVMGSPDPERSWTALGYLMVGIALYFALVNWSLTQQHPWLLIGLIGGCGAGLAALGPAILIDISNEFWGFSDELVQSKPLDFFGTGETINPNVLGGILATIIPLLFAGMLEWNGATARWLRYTFVVACGLLTIMMLATLILAQSRGAYVAAATGIAVVLIARWPWSALVIAIALSAATVVLAGNGVIGGVEALSASGSITSLSGRWEVWERAVYAVRDFPLTGIGMGTFDKVIPVLYPYVEITNGADIPHAHNLWLQVGVDLGLPGLVLYTWLLVALFRSLRQTMRHAAQTANSRGSAAVERPPAQRRQRQEQRQMRRAAALRWTMAAGLLGAFTALLVGGLGDAVAWGTKLAFVPWLLISLAALLAQQDQKSQVEE